MKKLTGIEKGFSSFENKEMKNLQSIIGGGGTQQSIQSNVPSRPDAVEHDKYTDNGRYIGRIEVGPLE
ncbi:hypothetical protein J2X31_002223 [Flavobacterium arsenatis]|uniref:Bacteriocin n=1 Tax=Flavobacterium arsenatis TaxID=1484332 RepID=A0ABU1TQP8_9FLAO|nr:hypothetical protein [Flavobacterium arsenatis]MDR6968208.1 hypothetical protein [Flavobacterium arsenatis]